MHSPFPALMSKPKAAPAAPAATSTANAQDSAREPPAAADTPVSTSPDDSLALAMAPVRVQIVFNPSAGDVHMRERGMPWRSEVELKTAAANEKAREEQLEKRRWGLAKQVQDGLMHNFRINYGIAELANIIKEGMAHKRQPPGRDLTPHEVAHVQFLAAAEKYDLKQLVVLLDKFPKGPGAAKKSAK